MIVGADETKDILLATVLVRDVAAGHHPGISLDWLLPPTTRPVVEALAERLEETDRVPPCLCWGRKVPDGLRRTGPSGHR